MKTTSMLLLLPLFLGLSACDSRQSHTLDSMMGGFDIVGGEAVAKEDPISKHIVALEHPFYGVFCTGVLVKKNVIITAAHCTGLMEESSYGFNVVFGADLRGKLERRKILGGKTTDKWPKLTEAEITKIDAEWGDLAMLKFEGEAPAGFEPARILGSADRLQQGMDVVLAGYGLAAMPDTDPMKLMKATVKLTNPKLTPSEIQFDQYQGKGACHGDSGGPAFATINDKLFLIGITSRSATEAGAETCMEGSVYTSVAAHIDFLVKTAKFLDSADFVAGAAIPQPKGTTAE